MKSHAKAGFTLIEMMLALALVTILISSAVSTVQTGQSSFRQTVTSTTQSTKAVRALNRLVKRVTSGGKNSLLLVPESPDCTSQLLLQDVIGYESRAPIWSGDFEISLEYEPGEIDNGMDDDGDGLVDECQIVQVEDPGGPDERSVVLLRSVAEFLEGETPNLVDDNGNGLEDERGLCFTRDGNAMFVHLTVLRVGAGGIVSERTLQTTVALRN